MLWTANPSQRDEIRDRLGWLNVAEKMLEHADEFRELEMYGKAFTDVVLLGMGGSSLCPDVMRKTFGVIKGHPKLHVLDTTDPATILGVRAKITPNKTLFVVASKSGETTEKPSQFAYFWGQVTKGPTSPKDAKAGRPFHARTSCARTTATCGFPRQGRLRCSR